MNPEVATDQLVVRVDGKQLLSGIDLRVDAGTWLGLLGPNGAGKTTLLRALLGLVPTEGVIQIAGSEVSSRRDRARVLAFVPQRPVLPPVMTVAQYVLLGRTPHISYFGSESEIDIAAAQNAIDLLELTAHTGRQLQTLSGGEQQRVILARALAQEAPILLLDEPTSGLDIGAELEILRLIDGLRRERALTVISAIHDLTLAAQFCDPLLLLFGGGVVAFGDAMSVLTGENLRAYYHVDVEVLMTDDRVRAVLPQRALTSEEIDTPIPPKVSAP
jgi:iron complex transport system ATP-binding protein